MHRFHLGAQMRDAGQEVSLHRGPFPQASSVSLAAQLLGKMTSASHAAIRAEHKLIVQEALNGMDPIDREVLALRHFEHLSNDETALVLGLTKSAASNRYIRALKRLKEILSSIPGLTGAGLCGPGANQGGRNPASSKERRDEHLQRRAATRSSSWPRSSSTASAAASSPTLREYVERHPELADEIRDLFPALLMMEDWARLRRHHRLAGR